MCGIAGIYAFNASGGFDGQLIQRMVDKIFHRGPDENAIFVRDRIGLGISRLAIIDPGGSHQPIFNEDQSVAMVFNGEIYNYKNLRDELEESGHRFATDGDGRSSNRDFGARNGGSR